MGTLCMMRFQIALKAGGGYGEAAPSMYQLIVNPNVKEIQDTMLTLMFMI